MLCLLVGIWSSTVQADTAPATKAGSPSTKVPTSIVFVPHDFGAPEVTEAGGVRGAPQTVITLLAPPALSKTLSPTPAFYWHIDQPIDRARFTLTGDTAVEPLLEVTLEPMAEAGIYNLDLAAHHVALGSPGLYRWSVATDLSGVPAAAQIVAETQLVYDGDHTAPPTDVPAALAGYLAENGYWYDLLDLVSRQMATAAAESDQWQALRTDLLQQVGLAP
jgi:hypothetical protein